MRRQTIARNLLKSSGFAAALIFAAATAPPAAAAQFVAYTTTSVNQRAGPGTDFPVLVTVPNRTRIVVYGCLQAVDWCDVEYRSRGWMSADYIQAYYQGRYYPMARVAAQMNVGTVSFNIKSYWSSYYRDRPFYSNIARWSAGNGGASIKVGVFYDRLASDGRWTEVSDRYVWVPNGVDRDWRPYTRGRWVYTRGYGWTWASNEPFGWATYHYGRWAFSKRIGWFWVPGTQWAPAWVAWRSSGDHLAWAPLPPERNSGLTININIGDVPSYYWQVVPTSAFLSVNLSDVIVRDERQFKPLFDRTKPLGTVEVSGEQVVNTAVSLQTVEEQTKEKVVVHEVAKTDNVEQSGQVSGDTVEVFTPPATEQTATPDAPPEVASVKQVEEESQTKGQAGDQKATEDQVPPEPVAAAEQPATGEQPAAAGAEAPAPNEGAPPAQEPPPPTSETPSDAAPPVAPAGDQPACPENTVRQDDGKCAAPTEGTPAEPPPPAAIQPAADQPTVEKPAEPPLPANAAPAEPAPAAQTPPATAEPAPPSAAEPPPPKAEPASPPPPAANQPTVENPAEPPPPANAAPAEAAPAAQTPPATAEPAPPSAAEPPPPKAEPAPPPPAAGPPPPPAAEPPPPAAQPEAPPPCPEGQTRQPDGACGVAP